ncbi:MAG TPA: ATP-dependent RNA helicase HrpA [Gammaproteobacteria bacterium]
MTHKARAAGRAAEERVALRRAARYTIRYPDLPIARARDEIRAALEAHRVIVVCGDTGSGKTTQLPKICLEAGRGVAGMIGHTQPRRIAARALAARLAEELETPLGETVGLKVRFTDRTSPSTVVKVMTDGILLNEIRGDRRLEAYDTLIIDEAHERSLNIDFLLGYLRRIERQRPDLRIVITSATIDPESFSRHFGGAPIIRVAGRTFPVETRYRPLEPGEELAQGVVRAAVELAREPLELRDMLVFLPGERWIREAERALAAAGPGGFELLPLYARLSTVRQQRIFHPGRAPRIVLATNVAETSLTVPRIGAVIDSGLARVARYSPRHRVQGLGVEPIARANAVQRAGRCGRLAPGVCVRLYAEQDFDERPAFTEPEILRTNLAGVILQLEALGLGHVEEFPFLDAPPARAVQDAYRLLHLLGAFDEERRLTSDGRLMARLPVDPRVARLLVVANRHGALREGLVIGAALSVPDPREHPPEHLEAARQRHRELADPRSDFLSLVNLWQAFRQAARGGERAWRAWAAERFLSASRLREWQDVHDELARLARDLGWRYDRRREADYAAIHQAVLAAFVDHVAEQEEGARYCGQHGARALLFPGSALARKRPRWIVAAERVATERTYLRTAAQINPRWVVRVAPHLVRRDYRDAEWDRRRGRVTAREVITLFGLTLSSERRVDFGPVDPAAAREIFIREALVGERLGVAMPFLEHNRRIVRELLEWEARRRARDLFVGEAGVRTFYEARLPAQVRDRGSLERWCRTRENARRLRMSTADVATRDPETLPRERYPDALEVAGQRLPLEYRYEPGAPRDGLTVRIPAALVGSVRAEALDWLVPGWLPDKALAMLRGLPKERRRPLVPLPDTVAELLPEIERRRHDTSVAAALAEALAARRGVAVDAAALERVPLPAHLAMRVEIVDADGKIIASGRDFRALQRRFDERPPPAPEAARAWVRSGLTRWDLGDLPDEVVVRQGSVDLRLYPALLDERGRVDLQLLPPGPAAVARHRAGVRRLLVKSLPQQAALVRDEILGNRELVLAYHGVGRGDELVDDLLGASAEASFELDPPIRTAAAFATALEKGRAAFVPNAERLREGLLAVLRLHRELRARLASPAVPERARRDIAAQLDALVHPGFLTETPAEWQGHLLRYLRAVETRLRKLAERHPKDEEFEARVRAAARPLEEWRARQPPGWPWPAAVTRYRWLLEEFRVSLFAQSLGTAVAVSEKRLQEAWRRAMEETR